MLKIITRYILKETFTPLLLSLTVFTFSLLSGNFLKLSDLIINKGVNFFTILELFLYLTPYLLSYTLPISLLAAVTIAFGRLSQDNEIVALNASGISLYRIVYPVLLFSLGISLFSMFINMPIVAKAHYKMRMVLLDLGYKKPEALLEPGRFIAAFNRYIFHIKEIDGKKLKQIIIYESLENNTIRTIIAEEGLFEIPESKDGLILHLVNGTAEMPNPNNTQNFYKMHFKSFPIILELDQASRKIKLKYKRLKEMSLKEIKEEMKQLEEKGLSTNRHRAEFQRKFSFSLASFIFALIGIPLAIRFKRGDRSSGIGLTLTLATIYYLLFSIGKTLANEGTLNPILAMWLPNIIIGVLGLYFFFKIQRS